MSGTDESRELDAGWDDEEPSTDEVDGAWDSATDSVVPSVGARPSIAPRTEEVDEGWDDAPEPANVPGAPPQGKRRPHRQRRATNPSAASASSSPVLRPRPAENAKKQQRDHSRASRAKEALTKQQRKDERKTQRSAEARAEAEARVRAAEAAAEARRMRDEARARALRERPAPKKAPAAAKPAKAKPRAAEVSRSEPAAAAVIVKKKPGLRPGVLITLVVLALVAALVLLRK